jgi:hypothetical protein
MDTGYGQARHSFSCRDINNWFGIIFYLDHLPRNGEWPIVNANSQQDPTLAVLGFYYHNRSYGISPNETKALKASENNNKASYYLAPTWFVNTNDANDSVLIQGVFNEP